MEEAVIIRPHELKPRESYKLMISIVVPRPIAWVTSLGPDGTVNAAPFSYFSGVTSRPPIIAVSVAPQRDGPKDTARNIEATGEFVVNIVNEDLAEAMNRTATEYPYGVSEIEAVGLALSPGETVSVPRISGCPAAIECRVHQIIPVGEPPVAHILGLVEAVVLAEGVRWEGSAGVPVEDLRPVGRLGANRYARIRELFEMDRIPYPPPPGESD